MAPDAAHKVGSRQSEVLRSQFRRDRGLFSTCEIIGEFTGDFRELTPQVEAIYIEHLIREHDIQP